VRFMDAASGLASACAESERRGSQLITCSRSVPEQARADDAVECAARQIRGIARLEVAQFEVFCYAMVDLYFLLCVAMPPPCLYSLRKIKLLNAYIQVLKALGYRAKTAADKLLNARKGS
jgi:hypothetical protein